MVLIRDIVAPEEGLLFSSDGIQLKIGHKTLTTGTLYITEESLSWKPADQNEGISVLWKNISLHGVSNNPTKNVYVMLDHMLVWPGVYDPGVNQNGGGGGDAGAADAGSDCDEGNESDCEELTEMWFTPTDPNAIDPIFQAMKECQALNPDSADSISDESDFMDAQEDEQEVGQDDLRNLQLDDKFADAEED